MGQILKALSIRQPYASWLANPQWFIAQGVPPKRIENRDWPCRYRGRLLIHASQNFESDAYRYWSRELPDLVKCVSADRRTYPAGAIVGIADLVDCVDEDCDESEDPWFCGDYGFVLANARPLLKPIPCRGALGLFGIPLSVLKEVML